MNVKLLNLKIMKTLKQKFLKKNISLLFVGLLFASTFAAAQDITVRETPEFNGVEVGGVFNVFLTQAPICSVEFESEGLNPEDIEANVKDGILELSYNGSLPRGAKVTAKITAPYFSSIEASGVVNLKSTNTLEYEKMKLEASGATKITLDLITDDLYSEISGASNVYLKGKATIHKINISGASLLKADELASDVVAIDASGASNLEIDAKSKLTAGLSGTSKLVYIQEPLVKEISASGLSKVGVRTDGSVSFGDPTDTVRIKMGSHEVWLMDDGVTKKAKKAKRAKFRNTWSGIDFGMNAYVNPEQSLRMKPGAEFLELEHNKSWAINFNLFQKRVPIIKNNFGIYTGIGFGFNNYRLADNSISLIYNLDGIDYIDESFRMKKNKLVLSHLNIPLMLEFQTQGPKRFNKFNLAVGGNLGILMGSYTRQTYDIDGNKMKRKFSENYHISPFRYEVQARIGYAGVHLFASYALNSLFKDGKGPELYPFSVGVSFTN
jgi:hypothetical protein